MGALIEITNQVSSNLPNEELITLLKQKVENSVMYGKYVIVIISNPMMEVRNSVNVEEIEFFEEYFRISDWNFELHINLNETEITYDNTFKEVFTFKRKSYKDEEIILEFL